MSRNTKVSFPTLVVLTLIFYCATVSSSSRRRSHRQTNQEDFQKHTQYLEELQKLAKEGDHPDPDSVTKYDSDVCYTYDCIEAAKEIMFATNFTVDPCNDGTWLNFTCVRRTGQAQGDDELDDTHQQGQVGYLGSVALGQTLAMLESKNLSPLMRKVQIYYEQCEKWKHEGNDELHVEAITNYLKTFGKWPLLNGIQSPGEDFDWMHMMANTVRVAVAYGVAPYLFDIFIEEEDVPLLFTGELTLHKKDEEIAQIIQILSLGKKNLTDDDYKQIKEMRDFMANLTHPVEERIESDQIQNVTAHHDFGKNFSLEYFYKEMLAGTRIKITPETEVATDIEWLKAHVKAVNEVEPRVIANILFLQTASALLTRLTTQTHTSNLPALVKYRGTGPMDCLKDTYEKFDFAMSHEFIRRYYDYNGTQTLVKLVDDMKYGYEHAIEHAPFLTSQTKVFAIDKARDIHTFIAAENWVTDPKKLAEYYQDMNITEDQDFVMNHVIGLRFHWAKFLELTDVNVFSYLVGDAYTGYVGTRYNYHFNQIRIQAALVQKPLFSYKYPGFMNYGGIGTVLSHELAHSFDTNGVHFNKHGHRGDYWDDVSYEAYYNWTDSLVADYNSDRNKHADPWGSFSIANIDHSMTINDDIADLIGVHISYYAYQKYLADLKADGRKEAVLPGLKEFTSSKLFWMKYTNMWCEHTEKSYLHALRHFNMHSPGNVRATLPLTRSKEWANDFQCRAPELSDF